MSQQTFIESVYKNIQKNQLIQPGERVVVGVSGGRDSMALLYLLVELRDKLKIEILVAHLNHQLRGSEAEEDFEFVRAQVCSMDLLFLSGSMNVREYAQEKRLSIEDAAREARYSFFEKIAGEHQAQKVAVAHTRDDQAQTVLMRIMRGTGLDGLEAMTLSRALGKVMLIRPLLKTAREELTAYLQEKKILWREDSSNQDLELTRNKVRNVLIPLLEKEFNPDLKASLSKTSDLLSCDNEYLNNVTAKEFKKCVRSIGQTLCLDLRIFKLLDLAIQRRVIREMFHKLCPFSYLSFNDVARVLSLIHDSQSGRRIDLPHEIRAYLESGQLMMGRPRAEDVLSCETVQVPGEKILFGKWVQYKISVRFCDSKEIPSLKKNHFDFSEIWNTLSKGGTVECCEYFDASHIEEIFTVRQRQEGDVYHPIGMKSSKKVKEILINEKVPLRFRIRVPLFESGGKIFWIGGYRISEAFKVKPETQKVLEVQLRMEGGRDV